MSDTPTPPPQRGQGVPPAPAPSSRSEDVSVDADLKPQDGEDTISDTDALKILETRFAQQLPRSTASEVWSDAPWNWRFHGGQNVQSTITTERRDLLSRVVRMIPLDQRTTSVFQFVDIRPILQELILTEQQAKINPRSKVVNGIAVGPEARVEAGKLLLEQNEVIHDEAFVLAASMDADPTTAFKNDAEREAFINKFVYSYRDPQAGLTATPELAIKTLGDNVTEAGAAAAQLSDLSLFDQYMEKTGRAASSTPAYQYLSNDDVQWMFRMDMVDWNNLLKSEGAKATARASGQSAPADFMVDAGAIGTTPQRMTPTGTPLAPNEAYEKPMGSQRLLDVFNSLYGSQWSEQEITNLQDKLLAAGYIKTNDDGTNDLRWTGLATDPATQAAWKQLVVDSVNSGVDMGTLLKNATLAHRAVLDAQDKASARDIVLTSAVGIRQTANALGKQTIGRELSQEQQAGVIEYIHNLERNQQQTMNAKGSQTVEDVDVEAAVADFIKRENPTETGAYDLLNQFNTFQSVARRPG